MTNKEIQDRIIYQDFYYVIANKPAGVSAQDDKSEGKSFHKLLEEFCNKQLYVVHRLDRPTSGVIIFAKKKSAATYIGKIQQENHEEFTKVYVAAVKNPPKENKGTLEHYLFHDHKQRKSWVVSEDTKGAKKATLTYETIASIENYTLLQLSLLSGRFHQIRAQLGAIGSPVKGDVKYGARRGNKDRSINLHAYRLEIPFKGEGEGLSVQAAVPTDSVWDAFRTLRPDLGINKHKKWKVEQM